MSRHKSLISACQNGNRHYVEYILKNYDVDPSANENEALLKACQSGECSVVSLLLQDKRVQSGPIGRALEWTSEHCHHLKSESVLLGYFPAILELLLQYLVIDEAFLHGEPICWASRNGNVQLVKKLLEDNRVDPRARDSFAIVHASFYRHFEVVKLLLQDKRVDPAARSNLPMKLAADDQCWPIVSTLVANIRVDPMSSNMPIFDNISVIKERASMVCIGLQDLNLPALQTLEILDALFPTNTVSMYKKWQLVTLIKHFKH